MQSVLLIVLIGLLGGVAVGVQSPLASLLSQRLGPLESIFIIHLGGMLCAAVPLLLQGGGQLGSWRSVPWYALAAGSLGAVVVGAITFVIPRLGVTATVLLIVAGQLLVGTAADQIGWLGATIRPLDLPRLAGIALLLCGAWLVIR